MADDTHDERAQVHVRLRPDLLRRLDHAAIDMGVKRAGAIEALIEEALPQRSDEVAAQVAAGAR